MQKRKKILASVSVLLVALLVGAMVTNAVPAPVIEPISIRPMSPSPPPGEKGIYTTIIPYDNLAKAGETISIEGKVHNDGNKWQSRKNKYKPSFLRNHDENDW